MSGLKVSRVYKVFRAQLALPGQQVQPGRLGQRVRLEALEPTGVTELTATHGLAETVYPLAEQGLTETSI